MVKDVCWRGSGNITCGFRGGGGQRIYILFGGGGGSGKIWKKNSRSQLAPPP